jgi:4-aminobutyrate aminotransferase / (S)-3-amino-2-methylpropionate transaminase
MKFASTLPTYNTTRLGINLQASYGSYFVDHNRKKYLDLFGQIASCPLGYNHPMLTQLAKTTDPAWLTTKPCLGLFPPEEHPQLIKSIKFKCNMSDKQMYTMATGSEANENAIKLAYLHKTKNIVTYPEEALDNMGTNYKIISFDKGFHGRTLGTLSATYTNPIYKQNIPAFPWLRAQFPTNTNEIDKSLEQIESYIIENNIAGCIIEPIQSEGGDRHAPNGFFVSLREMLYRYEIPLIVDEVQTGMGTTGTLWKHEQWNLKKHNLPSPEIITFSKKAQTGGIFCNPELVPAEPYKIFNTWMGNLWDVTKMNTILDVIEEEKLLKQVQEVGDNLLLELNQFNGKISNIRGSGTFCAFDHPNSKQLMNDLQKEGVLVGCSGQNSIRLRPPLNLSHEEADEFIFKLKKVL